MEKTVNTMYAKLPNLIIGFHGCSIDTHDKVLKRHESLKVSDNKYDWLGNGIYFWENSYQRAYDWAVNKYNESAAVVGAIIDLGLCLNLTDYNSTDVLKKGYEMLKMKCDVLEQEMPKNRKMQKGKDILLRDLDCAVIQQIHEYNSDMKKPAYDSVRGVFVEGGEIYQGSGFCAKTHTQLCIVNPNCIKGYFEPIAYNEKFSMP